MRQKTKNLRRYFISGLVIWLPIWATFVVIRFIFNLLDSTVALLPAHWQPNHIFGTDIPGIGLILTLFVLLLTGMLTANFVGDWLLRTWEKLLARIPLVRSIYSAVKQVTEALIRPKSGSFRNVVLVEFPKEEVWSIAFQTSDAFKHGPTDEDYLTLFIPTTPNPTSGFLTIIPKRKVYDLDMNVEEALRMVISLGVVQKKEGQPADVKMHKL